MKTIFLNESAYLRQDAKEKEKFSRNQLSRSRTSLFDMHQSAAVGTRTAAGLLLFLLNFELTVTEILTIYVAPYVRVDNL